MREVIAMLATDAAAGGLAFASIYFTLPVAGLSPSPVARLWSAVGGALLAVVFGGTGENLFECVIKSILVALLTATIWLAKPTLGYVFISAVIGCAWGTAGCLASRRLERHHRRSRSALETEQAS